MNKILHLITMLLLLTISTLAETKWYTNLEEAQKLAVKEKKAILINFTGSDWCGWCIKLEKEVFSTTDFEKYAKDNLVLVKLDFPNKIPQTKEVQQYNTKLQNTFAVEGFPALFLLNPAGEVVGRFGYMEGGPVSFFQFLSTIYSAQVPNSVRTNVEKLFN